MFKAARTKISVEVLTQEFVLSGQLFIPPGGALADLFNQRDRPFLPMSEVTLSARQGGFGPGDPLGAVGFLLLRREQCLVALGDQALPALLPGQGLVRVRFVLPTVLVEGSLIVPAGARLSDALNRPHAFLPIGEVHLYAVTRLSIDATGRPLVSRAGAVVNLAAVLAVTDADGTTVLPA